MNPLAIVSAADAAGKSDVVKKAGKVILLGGTLVGGYFLGKYILEKIRENQASDEFGDNPNIQVAVALRNAFNPWGMSIFINVDGTLEERLYDIARTVSDWKNVSKEYRKLYNETLLERLQKEFNSAELQKFTAFINQDQLLLAEGSTSNLASAFSRTDMSRIVGNLIPMEDWYLFDPNWVTTVNAPSVKRWSNEQMDEIWTAIQEEANKPWYANSDEDRIINLFKTAESKFAVGLLAYRIWAVHGTWYMSSLGKFMGSDFRKLHEAIRYKPMYS